MTAFHEIRFPTAISIGSSGGPERLTRVVSLASGHEQRNTPWADSRRRYEAGLGVRHINDLYDAVAFFEARRGPLYGFRWKDWADYRSGRPGDVPAPTDQVIGTGDGSARTFQLVKSYGDLTPWARDITKPTAGTTRVSIDGAETTAFSVDETTGVITLDAAPAAGETITAGFEFDVPARFESDRFDVSLSGFQAGEIPSIPILEVRV